MISEKNNSHSESLLTYDKSSTVAANFIDHRQLVKLNPNKNNNNFNGNNNDDEIKTSENCEVISNKTSVISLHRPSSPRKFFEKLYGHLESKNEKLPKDNGSCPNSPSVSRSSSESLEHTDKKLLQIDTSYERLNSSPYLQTEALPSQMDSLRGMISLPSDIVFPPGLAAFCKY